MSPSSSPLSVEEYARLVARIREAPPTHSQQILAAAGLTPASWQGAATDWRTVLDADCKVGRRDRLDAFAIAYREESARMQRVRQEAETAAAKHESPPPKLPAASVDETSWLVSPVGPPLPFAAPAAGDESTAPSPPAAAPVEPHPDTGATGELAAPDVDLTMPFLLRGDLIQEGPEPSGLDLRRYASLCAELSEAAEPAARTRNRYGVNDEAAYATLTAYWNRRFAREPAMRAEHQRLMAEYRAWLRQKGHQRTT
jgi:hypothetical protein